MNEVSNVGIGLIFYYIYIKSTRMLLCKVKINSVTRGKQRNAETSKTCIILEQREKNKIRWHGTEYKNTIPPSFIAWCEALEQ